VKRILVCDDDAGILEVTKIILETNGYQVETLDNGKSIIKKVKRFKPNLILLDLWMPGIEGKEITKLLKADPETKTIPLILVSAVNELGKIASGSAADGYLSKPFDMTELLSLAKKHTRG
jgi:two-component system phosphate regulon response regulator PhoB